MSFEEKRKQLLGMSFGTARAKLDRDLVFKLATEAGHVCYRCGEQLTRDDFSVDHKTAWLKTNDAKAAFFDLENIAFSHLHCNRNARVPYKIYPTVTARDAARHIRRYTPEWRHDRYIRTGK